MQRFAISLLTLGAIVFSVSGVSGFAQSHSVRDLAPTDAGRVAVRVYTADAGPTTAPGDLAAVFTMTSLFQPVIEDMLRRSPTFRRQCQRLVASGRVHVSLHTSVTARERMAAWTVITRLPADRIGARISIPLSDRMAELIAHEVEHVIEQLDGISLADMARIRDSGVRNCDCAEDDTYETIRAVRVGRQVAAEMDVATLEARRFDRRR